jgi:hypothetical protein
MITRQSLIPRFIGICELEEEALEHEVIEKCEEETPGPGINVR